MFEYKAITDDQMRDFVNAHVWHFAKSMPFIPHWYTVKRNVRDESEFFDIVRKIRLNGKERRFGKNRFFIYYDLDAFTYWTMDENIFDTTIINRAYRK